jgi:hypothetical protein
MDFSNYLDEERVGDIVDKQTQDFLLNSYANRRGGAVEYVCVTNYRRNKFYHLKLQITYPVVPSGFPVYGRTYTISVWNIGQHYIGPTQYRGTY